MKTILKIAVRNLLRYRRRSLMTALLIVIGMVLVILFSGVAGSFKTMMVGTLTDSMLGHLQIHRKGYVSSIDNLPLHLNIKKSGIEKIRALLEENPSVEAYTFRIKLGAMVSNFDQTTNIRLTAVVPEMEVRACPALPARLIESAEHGGGFIRPGQVIVPENLAGGLELGIGDEVVLVATNEDGSVNGMSLKVAGILEGLLGPSGRDGYIHMEDALTLLRIDGEEVNEVAIRLKNTKDLESTRRLLARGLEEAAAAGGTPALELHSWAALTPFSSIAMIVDLLIVTVKIVLIAIVLVSIMNVMMMSVYERMGEIGTIAAIGTLPSQILWLFLAEGVALGLVSTLIGVGVGAAGLVAINLSGARFSFGRVQDIPLEVSVEPAELLAVSAIVLAVTAVSSLQPALKASRMDPVEALKHGGG